MSGHVGHQGMGGYYPRPYEADSFRAAVYKMYDLHPEDCYNRSSSKLSVLYLPRGKFRDGRNLLNVAAMETMSKDEANLFSYRSLQIHKFSMKEQVLYTMQTDILLSVHGAAVATIMFLLPHSAYIELRPPNFRDNWYNLLSNQAQLLYRPMNNFSYPLPPECPSIDDTLNPPVYQQCWKKVHFANFLVCVECLHDVLLQLYYDVNLLKYTI